MEGMNGLFRKCKETGRTGMGTLRREEEMHSAGRARPQDLTNYSGKLGLYPQCSEEPLEELKQKRFKSNDSLPGGPQDIWLCLEGRVGVLHA